MNKKIKIVLMPVLLICSITLLIISTKKIWSWNSTNIKTDNIIEKIKEIEKDIITEVDDTNKTSIIENNINPDEIDPYWGYIKMKLIDVDFYDLKVVNKETVGWIQVNGTNINYPFVQTNNNTFYLNHSFDKSVNDAGWVFLDSRNNMKGNDKNLILYAHGRVNGSMFGTLRNILNSSWIDNPDNYVIKLSTEHENTLWQIFSVYHIPKTNDYIRVNFESDDSFLEFANNLKNRSMHDFKTSINKEDKILTLSTCYSEEERMVIHAKLIKKLNK